MDPSAKWLVTFPIVHGLKKVLALAGKDAKSQRTPTSAPSTSYWAAPEGEGVAALHPEKLEVDIVRSRKRNLQGTQPEFNRARIQASECNGAQMAFIKEAESTYDLEMRLSNRVQMEANDENRDVLERWIRVSTPQSIVQRAMIVVMTIEGETSSRIG